MIWTGIQLVLILFFPAISLWMHRQKGMPKWLSPVVLCYALGIILRNFDLIPLNDKVATTATEASILLALPLLLFSTHLKSWFKEARYALLCFALFVVSGLLCNTISAFFFKDFLPDTWRISGMITGIFTGGTPNMQAIGIALDAKQETIILLNAADILCSGIYLIFLSSVLHGFLGRFLPAYEDKMLGETFKAEEETSSFLWTDSLKGIALAAAIIALSVGSTYLLFGNLENSTFIILLLTTLSIIAASWPRIRALNGTFETGEYFLLIFCVALGMLANFGEIMASGMDILYYTAATMSATILLHFFLAWLFKIDRDTVMIASTAGIFGPVFIGQVASAIGNKKLIFTGIALGLLGFAIGNYLGISLAYFLKNF